LRIKPNCELCGRPYLGGGQDGRCRTCAQGAHSTGVRKRLRCLCRKVAVVVMLGEVLTAEGEPMDVEVPLCIACRALELELELALTRMPARTGLKPVQVVVVKNLPRPKRPLSGRRF